ncbi:9-O-acetylesterase [soil metagenome]
MFSSAAGELRLPSVFSEHMVLQRDIPVKVWGWASPGASVTVTAGERDGVGTMANEDGEWMATLPAMEASGEGIILRVEGGGKSVEIGDVLVGEVWLCSGQSNMEWTVASSHDRDREIAEAKHPEIRQIKIPHAPASRPVDDREAEWVVCSPETAGNFSAVGYFFAREIQAELGVPVGILNSSWGGTRIEPWVPAEAFVGSGRLEKVGESVGVATLGSDAHVAAATAFVAEVERWVEEAKAASGEGEEIRSLPTYPDRLKPLGERENPHQLPTTLYNGMVAPLVPYGLKGALWYQGESNHREGDVYVDYKTALVGGWRDVWGLGEFPFYFVQIAPYQYGDEAPEILAEFWEIQAESAKANPKTEMVVINDIGDLQDIHPTNKQEVGRRLARLALADTYGVEGLGEVRSPELAEVETGDGVLRLRFEHVGDGLRSRDDQPLSHFEIMGKERLGFVEAEAEIEGSDTVVLRSAEIPDPISVRFAWNKLAVPNLVNSAGLPAGAFRGGDVQVPDRLVQEVPEAQEMELVYDIDLEELGHEPAYETDAAAGWKEKPFTRVGYFLELEDGESRAAQWVWVSMDAFTDDAQKLGIPTVESGARFQQSVAGMRVVSNADGVATGDGLTGNLEFWPNNYSPENGAEIPGASGSDFDIGDAPTDPADGYGSMQIHNTGAKQTVLAINNWREGQNADIGIGNSKGKEKDWTFSGSGSRYSAKRLRIFLR